MEELYGFTAACLAASLIEYGLHRAMHFRYFRRTPPYLTHLKHHRTGNAQPLLREAFDYAPIAAVCAPFGLLGGIDFFWGWLVGAFGYAFLVAIVHNYSHHRGNAHHESHHAYPKYNFGVVSPLWDLVFRTYRRPSERLEGLQRTPEPERLPTS